MVTTEQEQPAPERQQEQGQPQPEGQAPAGQRDLNTLLQEQIAQAIQPVLADFRQQFAHSIQTGAETRPPAAGNGGVESADALEVLPQRTPDEQRPAEQRSADEQRPNDQPPAEQRRPEQHASEEAGEPGETPKPDEQPEEQGIGTRLVPGRLRPALETGLHLAERQGEQWLQSMIVAGLEALLAESTHAAVQQRAEKGLHTLLQRAFDALPNSESATTRELRDQTERTLQAILRETLDAVFAEDVRGTLLDHGRQASSEALHARFGGALQHVQEALRALLGELVDVLRQQWQRVLRLLLRLILTALQDSIAPEEGESLTSISTEPVTEPVKEKTTRAKRGRQSKEPSSRTGQTG